MTPLKYSRDRRTLVMVLSAAFAGAITLGVLAVAIVLAAGGVL